MGIISPRMDEVLELVGSVDFESCPPNSHPVSSLRPRLASLFWASRNCWRAFARGTSSWKTCRVLMVMRMQKIWEKCNCWTVERTICECRKKATRIKVVKHLAILELQQFRMMQLPIIINDILHANLQVRYGCKWHAMKCLQPSLDSFQTEPPAQAPSPSPSHAWALDGRGTKKFKEA